MKVLFFLTTFYFLSGAVFVQASVDQIYSNGHGLNLPRKIQKNKLAQKYLAEFDKAYGVTPYEEGPLQYFRNDDMGLGLIKDSNQGESMFRNILREINHVETWGNGKSFISALENYTYENGCIPKITSVSHGWSSKRDGDVHGLSGDKGYNGLYATESTKPDGFISRWGTRSIEKDLKESIRKGKIRFCNRCLIQFYACNISTFFADTLAEASGCQTVVSTGKAYPHFEKFNTEQEKFKAIHGAHYWTSGAGNWAERGHVGWYRSTPVKSSTGETQVIRENIGKLYIAR